MWQHTSEPPKSSQTRPRIPQQPLQRSPAATSRTQTSTKIPSKRTAVLAPSCEDPTDLRRPFRGTQPRPPDKPLGGPAARSCNVGRTTKNNRRKLRQVSRADYELGSEQQVVGRRGFDSTLCSPPLHHDIFALVPFGDARWVGAAFAAEAAQTPISLLWGGG